MYPNESKKIKQEYQSAVKKLELENNSQSLKIKL
jgi:hypothetical protein